MLGWSTPVRRTVAACQRWLSTSKHVEFTKTAGRMRTPQPYVVPPLESTIERYMEFAKPLLAPAEADRLSEVAHRFQKENGMGARVQAELTKYAESLSSTSWIWDYWKLAYLEGREPLPIHTNPAWVLSNHTEVTSQIHRAAQLLGALQPLVQRSRRSHELLAHGVELPVELLEVNARGQIYCPLQHLGVFGGNRVPKLGHADEFVQNVSAKHVAVVCRGKWFRLELFDADGVALPFEQLVRSLSAIEVNAVSDPDVVPIGLPTGCRRPFWAQVRNAIIESSPEAEFAVQNIESASFVLALDDYSIDGSLTKASTMTLHAASSDHARSRWYDKLQLIVSRDGEAGFCVEHTAFDGHTILRIMDEVARGEKKKGDEYRQTFGRLQANGINSDMPQWVVPLPVDSTTVVPEVLDYIDEATEYVDSQIENIVLQSSVVDGIGFDAVKRQCGLSPDAFVQLAAQLTVCRLHPDEYPMNTYEAVHMRSRRGGRTEAMRPVTPEVVAMCGILNLPEKPSVVGEKVSYERLSDRWEKQKAITTAAKAHVHRIQLCQKGFGVDRHLYALKRMVKDMGLDESDPDLQFLHDPYVSPAAVLGRDLLSTSHCGSELGTQSFSFGPVAAGGYGLGYYLTPSSVSLTVSSWADDNNTGRRCNHTFHDKLIDSMREIYLLTVPGQGG